MAKKKTVRVGVRHKPSKLSAKQLHALEKEIHKVLSVLDKHDLRSLTLPSGLEFHRDWHSK